MYKHYKAWVGRSSNSGMTGIAEVLESINTNDEVIVSITPVGLDNISVLIITEGCQLSGEVPNER